eukprot:2479445-Pyramimonas_sp.AAC.1
MGEPELRAWCQLHDQQYQFWYAAQQMRVALERDDDELSDVAYDLGTDRLDELRELKKRAIEQPLQEAERDRLEELLSKQANQKAAKRARVVRSDATATFNRMLQQFQPR